MFRSSPASKFSNPIDAGRGFEGEATSRHFGKRLREELERDCVVETHVFRLEALVSGGWIEVYFEGSRAEAYAEWRSYEKSVGCERIVSIGISIAADVRIENQVLQIQIVEVRSLRFLVMSTPNQTTEEPRCPIGPYRLL